MVDRNNYFEWRFEDASLVIPVSFKTILLIFLVVEVTFKNTLLGDLVLLNLM